MADDNASFSDVEAEVNGSLELPNSTILGYYYKIIYHNSKNVFLEKKQSVWFLNLLIIKFFSCPEISDADFKLMNDMAYWLEGVIQTGKF